MLFRSDIITDGEIRRESYSNRFALALEGIDAEHPGEVRSQQGRVTPVPRVVGNRCVGYDMGGLA